MNENNSPDAAPLVPQQDRDCWRRLRAADQRFVSQIAHLSDAYKVEQRTRPHPLLSKTCPLDLSPMVYSRGNHAEDPVRFLYLDWIQRLAEGLIAVQACDIQDSIGTPTSSSPAY
jgi:hypothetical protein